jgi:hypothetical protein
MKNFFPYFAGSPPALVMSYSLFNAIVASTNREWYWWLFAFLGALAGVVGIIATEIYIYRNAARAFADREYKTMAIMALGGVIITAMMIYVVYTGKDTRSLITSSVATLVCYIALAGETYLDTKKNNQQGAVDTDTVQTQNQVSLLQAQAEIERQKASAERAKARQVSGQKVTFENRKVSESFGTDWRHVPVVDREKIARMTTKQISETYRVSERTALNWQTYSREQTK